MNSLLSRLQATSFAALLLSGTAVAAPALTWNSVTDSGAAKADRTRAVSMMTGGDVIAAYQFGSGSSAQIQVKRLATANGVASWTRSVGSSGFAADVADIVVDPATGDTYVAARVATASKGLDWFVFKIKGSDGTLAWADPYTSGGSGNDEPHAICFTSDGNIALAGMESDSDSRASRFRVTKLNSSTGVELWSDVSETDGSDGLDIVGDASGNIIAVGRSGADAYVAKYAGTGGTPTWTQTLNGNGNGNDIWNAVTLLSTGDIAVGGMLVESTGAGNFAVARYPAAGGAATWKSTINGSANADDAVFDLTTNGTDLFAAGLLRDTTNGQTAYVARIPGVGGAATWTATKNGTSASANATDSFFSIRLSGTDVLAAGTLTDTTNKANIVVSRYTSAGVLKDDTIFNGAANNQDRSLGKNLLTAVGSSAFAVGGDSENATPASDGVVLSYALTASEISAFKAAGTNVADELADNTGTFNFTSVNAGGSGSAQTFTIQNSGTADLTGIAVTSTNTSEFTVNSTGIATTLAPNATTTFTVTFSPSATGTRSGTINIASNDSDENPFRIKVSGTGLNNAPTDITLTNATLAEGNAANATVGTLGATDPDVGDSHTFSFVIGAGSDDNGSFTITGTTLKLTPVADFETKPTYNLRVQADDGHGGVFSKALVVTITDVNDAPTLAAITNPAAILEDAGQQTVNLSGITAGGETQVLTVTATSGNTALIADPTVTYTSPGTTGTLTYTPVANQSGSALITVTVKDNGTGTNSITRTFTVNVTAVNDAPTLAAISDPALLPISSPQQTVNLSGISEGPLEAAQTLTITAVSSNPSLIPNPAVTHTEDSSTGSLAYTPVAGQSGSALITVTVTDSGDTANGGVNSFQRTFTVTVSEAVSIAATDATADEAADTGTFTFTRSSSTSSITANFQRDVATTAGNGEYTLTGTGVTYDSATGAGSVVFPVGVTSVPVTLTGVADAIQAAEPAEIVKLNVVASAGVYQVGASGDATVTIAANGFLVTNTNDSGEGSLRQAVLNANATAGADTISFSDGSGGTTDFTDATPDTITLTSGEIAITQALTLAGQSPDLLTIQRSTAGGTPNFRVFNISGGGAVALSGITVANGRVLSSAKGGGILMNATPVTLANCVVRDSTASGYGGGIAKVDGTLVVRDSNFSGNKTGSFGAGFSTEGGATTLVNCSILDNAANLSFPSSAGGGMAFSGTVNIVNCVFDSNIAKTRAGAIFNYTATTKIINSTISGNDVVSGDVGGIYNQAGTVSIAQSTIFSNTSRDAGGGIFNDAGSTTLSNSIIAGNLGAGVGSDIKGSVTDSGNNLVGVTDGSTGVTVSTLKGTLASPLDPKLAPLANNGGATLTHALLPGSPAINAGSASLVPADSLDLDGDSDTAEPIPFDQRGSGYLRSIGTVDIGAFELQKSVSIVADASSKAEGTGSGTTAFTFTVSRSGGTADEVTMDYTVSGADVDAADFGGTLPHGQFTIPDGQASAVLTVNVSKDGTVEPDEAFTVTLSDASGGYVVSNGTASSTITNDDFAADLAITKTDGVTTAVPGNTVTYTITASNAGPSNVIGATVADTLPASIVGATWTAVGAGGGTATASGSGNINDTVNLPVGGSVTYTVTAPISAAATGTLSNTATVSSAINDPVPGNNSATDSDTLTPQANLAITKTDGVTTAIAGNTVTYTITASNAGPSNAPGSTVTDTLPASIVGATWTATGAGGGTATASGSGNINDTVNLPVGGSVTYTVTAPISSAATGTLSNTSTVSAPAGVNDPTPGNNSATDTDTLGSQADLAITKTDGVTTVTAGGSVTYTITASNAGPSNVTGATLADTFPASLTGTWTAVGAGGGTAPASGSGNINASVNLPAGGSVTFTVSAALSSAATGTLSNTATISSAVTDPTPGNNSATDSDTVTSQADLSITKTDGVTSAIAGNTVTYTITASNAGPSNVAGATVADTLPASIIGATWTAIGAGGGTATASGSGNINDTVNLPVGGSVTYTVTAPISSTATGTLSNTATVSSLTPDPIPGNNSATDTDTLTTQADLAITTTDGITTAVPGTSVTYTITASNAGPSNVTGATVADTFPASIVGATWTAVGAGGGTATASGSGNINDTVNLPVGGSVTYTVTAPISSAATGTISNTATVSSATSDPTPGNNSATDSDTLTPQANLAITKTDGVTTATPGGSVTYTITASNAGPSNATAATLADTLPASLTGTWTAVGAGGGTAPASGSGNINASVNLPAGGSVTFTVSATISAAATGTLSNTATIAAPAGVTDPTSENNSATDSDTLTPQADLAITKTDGVTTATPGGSVTYTITASNAGPSNVTTATLADTLPASLTGTWTAVGAGGGTAPASGSGNISAPVTLPAGGSVTFTVSATISAAATGTLSNTATISSAVADPTPGNNSATDTDTLAPQANLSITKTDGVTSAIAGNTVTYTIIAANAGPSNAPGSTVADTLPASIVGATWTAVGAGGGTATASGSGNINDTVNLPAGGSVTYTVTAPISSAATGSLSNTATVSTPAGVTDSTPANNSATDTDTLTTQANLAITKTDGVTTAVPGTSVTYTITASNAGPSNVTGATVADTLPAIITGATWTAVGAGGGTATASGSGNINDTVNLPVGGSVTYTVTAPISSTATGTLSNTATVSSSITDPTPGNNSATDTDTLTPRADLAVTKTDGVTTAIPGTSVTYTITASNAGPSNVTGATVADTLPAIITGATWTAVGAGGGTATASGSGNISDTVNLPVGGSVTYTVTAPVSSSATGELSNTATVSSAITDPTPGNNSATDTDTLTPRGDLAVTVSDAPDPVNALGNLTYTINLINNGPSTSNSPTVTLPLPASTTFVSASASGSWTAATPSVGGVGTVTFSNASLASGDTATFTVVAKVDITVVNDSTLTTTATASAATSDPVSENNTATANTLAKSGADLTLALSDSPDPVIAGTELTYTLLVANHGPLDAQNVSIGDTLPAGTTFVSLTTPAGWTASKPAVGASGNVTLTNPLFANAGTATFTLVVKVGASVADGTVIGNAASIGSDTVDIVPGNNSATTSTAVTTRADLAVMLSATPVTAPKSSNVTYSVTVTNNGPSDSVAPSVTLPIPAQMTFVSVTKPGAWTSTSPAVGAAGNVVFSAATLANGASATFTVVAKVKSSVANGTVVSATATASETTADSAPGNNSASAAVAVGTLLPGADQPITKNIAVNPQTGLFDVVVNVTNTTPYPINGFRLHVDYSAYKAAFPSLRLYNASSGANATDVYVDYPYPMSVDAVVAMKLSFYTSTRTFPSPFKPVLTIEILPSSQVAGTNGAGVQPRLVRLADATVLLEFPSVAGRWYRVRYSPDLIHWYDSPVPIQAGSNRMQWIDSGPPFTNVPPKNAPSRFYRVNEIAAP